MLGSHSGSRTTPNGHPETTSMTGECARKDQELTRQLTVRGEAIWISNCFSKSVKPPKFRSDVIITVHLKISSNRLVISPIWSQFAYQPSNLVRNTINATNLKPFSFIFHFGQNHHFFVTWENSSKRCSTLLGFFLGLFPIILTEMQVPRYLRKVRHEQLLKWVFYTIPSTVQICEILNAQWLPWHISIIVPRGGHLLTHKKFIWPCVTTRRTKHSFFL